MQPAAEPDPKESVGITVVQHMPEAPRLPEDFNTEADLLHLRDAIPQLEVWSEPWTKAELQKNYEFQQRMHKAEERRLREAADVAEALAKLEAAGQQDEALLARQQQLATLAGSISRTIAELEASAQKLNQDQEQLANLKMRLKTALEDVFRMGVRMGALQQVAKPRYVIKVLSFAYFFHLAAVAVLTGTSAALLEAWREAHNVPTLWYWPSIVFGCFWSALAVRSLNESAANAAVK